MARCEPWPRIIMPRGVWKEEGEEEEEEEVEMVEMVEMEEGGSLRSR